MERTGDEIKTHLNDYLGIYTGGMRKAMKISTIKKKIDDVLHMKKRGGYCHLKLVPIKTCQPFWHYSGFKSFQHYGTEAISLYFYFPSIKQKAWKNFLLKHNAQEVLICQYKILEIHTQHFSLNAQTYSVPVVLFIKYIFLHNSTFVQAIPQTE